MTFPFLNRYIKNTPDSVFLTGHYSSHQFSSMKQFNPIPVLIFFLFLTHLSVAQSPPASSFSGFFTPPPPTHDEMSPEQRKAIIKKLKQNTSELKRQGIISESQRRGPQAMKFTLPIRQAAGFNDPGFYAIYNFVDTALNSSQIKDYNCGDRTYDGHMGTDFVTFPYGWNKMDEDAVEVIAAADGVIIYKYDQRIDTVCVNCSPTSPADCWVWNAVYVRNTDGTISWYGHMKKGSATTKPIGASVSQGEYLGIVGSSGNSSVPHLHFEVWENDEYEKLLDPFAGTCNINGSGTESMWATQEPYYNPGINKVATTSGVPTVYSCYEEGEGEKPLYKNTFNIGEIVYFPVFARDNVPGGEPYKLKITKPSGAVLFDWELAAYPDFYASVWFNYFYDDTWINEPGQWTFEVTLNGKTASHNFIMLDPLPLKLLEFKAIKKHSSVELKWQTADEQNSDEFIIERSKDGQEFLSIGQLDAKGNSSTTANHYAFFDNDPVKGNNYYRLKMMDKDGSFEYSGIEKIYNGDEQVVSLFPNPAAKAVTVKGILGYENLSITDMYGKKLIEKTISQDTETIDISTLSNGIYLIQLNSNGKRKTLKLMKKD